MSETGVRPRLLSDVPSTVDQLGGHAKVAAAVSETLRRERGGRALALEGDWGAGKSTVVGLVERDFSGPDERMFVFDAWAHQGDPLRRSFLESLTESLLEPVGTTGSWVDEDWRGRLDQLARRRKTTVRKVHTEVREVAKFAALGALLVPLGLLILNREFNPARSHEADRVVLGRGRIRMRIGPADRHRDRVGRTSLQQGQASLGQEPGGEGA